MAKKNRLGGHFFAPRSQYFAAAGITPHHYKDTLADAKFYKCTHVASYPRVSPEYPRAGSKLLLDMKKGSIFAAPNVNKC